MTGTGVVSVRPARPEEWEVTRAVRLAALLEAPYAFCSTYEQALARTDEDWRGWPAPPGAVLLAWRDEVPVGIVGIVPAASTPDQAEIFSMWVAPEARGGGAADALIRSALAHAAGQGCTRVVLEVASGNPRATRVYARHGFIEIDRPTSMPGAQAMMLSFG